ncbi:hypothetical protein AB0J82_00810 [Asanoa sp. NPDC049518]|uniref:hypothetical protein n=1 Tax=unclassified Asanoa TaxID=2685164 RepID=UPI0034275BEC
MAVLPGFVAATRSLVDAALAVLPGFVAATRSLVDAALAVLPGFVAAAPSAGGCGFRPSHDRLLFALQDFD